MTRQPGEASGNSPNRNLLVDLFRADALHRMRYEAADEVQEARHVRQLGMRVKGGFVYPLGVNVENQGVAQSFEEMNTDAAGFGARRIEEQSQLFAELLFFARDGSKQTKVCSGKACPPASIAYTGPAKWWEQRSEADANARAAGAPASDCLLPQEESCNATACRADSGRPD